MLNPHAGMRERVENQLNSLERPQKLSHFREATLVAHHETEIQM